jgi:hypothetical protein
MLAVSIPQKLSCDKLQGERLHEQVGTLGGDGRSDLGVTTLGSSGTLGMAGVLIFVCDIVCRGKGMQEFMI